LPVSQDMVLDGRWLQYAVMGERSPVVVFESGLGADQTAWERVFPVVAGFTTAFAYSRPGYGGSERSPTPRVGSVVVEELRATLRARGLAPPYLLVGHSLGALYVQLFARLHPGEVAGLVLVDSSHPSQMAGPRPPQSFMLMLIELYMSGTRGREFHGLNATGKEVLRAPPFLDRPVTILSAGPDPATLPSPPLAQLQRRDIARLYPGSRQQWVDSGHNIMRERPQVVIDAIRDMVEQVRARGVSSIHDVDLPPGPAAPPSVRVLRP
jgi:pimeloyl-ACP methyl ester carboxylesterase